jgi:hypothetical protein
MPRELIAFFQIVVDTAIAIGLGSLAVGLYFEFVDTKRKSKRVSDSSKADLLHTHGSG